MENTASLRRAKIGCRKFSPHFCRALLFLPRYKTSELPRNFFFFFFSGRGKANPTYLVALKCVPVCSCENRALLLTPTSRLRPVSCIDSLLPFSFPTPRAPSPSPPCPPSSPPATFAPTPVRNWKLLSININIWRVCENASPCCY